MELTGASKTDIELYYLQKNIDDTEFELDEMDRKWRKEQSPCCPSCRFAPHYSDLCDQQERRRLRKEQLLKRKTLPSDNGNRHAF